MAKHRGFTFEKFINAVGEDLLKKTTRKGELQFPHECQWIMSISNSNFY